MQASWKIILLDFILVWTDLSWGPGGDPFISANPTGTFSTGFYPMAFFQAEPQRDGNGFFCNPRLWSWFLPSYLVLGSVLHHFVVTAAKAASNFYVSQQFFHPLLSIRLIWAFFLLDFSTVCSRRLQRTQEVSQIIWVILLDCPSSRS